MNHSRQLVAPGGRSSWLLPSPPSRVFYSGNMVPQPAEGTRSCFTARGPVCSLGVQLLEFRFSSEIARSHIQERVSNSKTQKSHNSFHSHQSTGVDLKSKPGTLNGINGAAPGSCRGFVGAPTPGAIPRVLSSPGVGAKNLHCYQVPEMQMLSESNHL